MLRTILIETFWINFGNGRANEDGHNENVRQEENMEDGCGRCRVLDINDGQSSSVLRLRTSATGKYGCALAPCCPYINARAYHPWTLLLPTLATSSGVYNCLWSLLPPLKRVFSSRACYRLQSSLPPPKLTAIAARACCR